MGSVVYWMSCKRGAGCHTSIQMHLRQQLRRHLPQNPILCVDTSRAGKMGRTYETWKNSILSPGGEKFEIEAI
jgi:hypothetical protein